MSDGIKRRDFLKVLGASGAAGAATIGCSTGDVDRLIPYVIGDENVVPSIPTWYASTCRECPAGCGIQVETHEGRATKVEGNPDHPVSRGNLCSRGQASVQGLYHPDRQNGPINVLPTVGPRGVTWPTAERMLADRIREIGPAGGDGIVFLTSGYTGSMARLADDFMQGVGGRRVAYEPFGGQPRGLDFTAADVLVAFGADFLETWGSPVDYAHQFSQLRVRGNGTRAKFIWIGAHRPMTGLNADQWIAPRPGTEALVARALAGAADPATVAEQAEIPQEVLATLIEEWNGANGVALGPGASMSGPAAAELRQVVAALNGGAPTTADNGNAQEVRELVERMQAGEVEMLLIDAADPAHTLPGGLGFEEALRQVPTRVSFSPFPDDTSRLCTMLLPNHHFLEQWGDYEPREGVTSLVQPAMRPVFNTRQLGDVLLSVARRLEIDPVTPGVEANSFLDYLRANWSQQFGLEGEAWRDAVRRGGEFTPPDVEEDGDESDPADLQPSASLSLAAADRAAAAARAQVPPVDDDTAGFHLVVYPSHRFYDGRNANRPWLLELPDPVTKVSWESYLEIHPAAAEELGVRQGDLLEVESPYGRLDVPAYIYPGVRRDTVALQMGLGQVDFGRYNRGRGVNANVLLGPGVDPDSGEFARAGVRVAVRATGRREPFYESGARVQYDREFAQAVSLEQLIQRAEEREPWIPGEDATVPTLRGAGGFAPVESQSDPAASFPTPGRREGSQHYGQYIEGITRWGMAIDLDRCTGCSACVTACYAENNIPVVGPDQLRRGRSMAWLRIERYFGVTRDSSEAYEDDATDDTRFLPQLCQHCGNAPCEPVCPVYAAYHTPEGLNAQIYNRCVGTRYCANNCPYSVRVFNWFSYEFEQPLNWQLNPDVTVRDKGVMEKCTFCVQRIHEAERSANMQDRPVEDGDVTPACVQTCPSEVFVFGNMADPESRVSQAARSHRGYRGLEEINTQPAIVYLQKVTLDEPAISEWRH